MRNRSGLGVFLVLFAWLSLATAPQAQAIGDTTPPVVTVYGDVTVEATSPLGANVTYVSASAVDETDGPIPAICERAPGIFPIGTTTVVCSATDAAGNRGTASFFVTVRDTTPPVMVVPTTITVNATSPAGATVIFGASARDDVDVSVASGTCSPGPGMFPIGTTVVSCSAIDLYGNMATASFRVVVLSPSAQTSDLRTTVHDLMLPSGTATALTAKLKQAQAAQAAGDTATACSSLSDFMSLVRAQSGKKIGVADATKLIDDATRVRTVLGC